MQAATSGEKCGTRNNRCIKVKRMVIKPDQKGSAGFMSGMRILGTISVLANASIALTLSTHTPRVQLGVYSVSASWCSELG